MLGKHKRKIKIVAVALCVVLIAGVIANQTGFLQFTNASLTWDGTIPEVNKTYKYSGGSGTSETNPWKIATAEDLAQLLVNVNGGVYVDAKGNPQKRYFQLTSDISLNDIKWEGIGSYSIPFSGGFDGNSHRITGLNVTYTSSCLGLFGAIQNATIKNLTVSGKVDVSGEMVGSIVGYSQSSTVENCAFSADSSYVSGRNYVGGIVGACDGTTIRNCSISSGKIEIKASGDGAGGIVGRMLNNSMMINCYNYANVTAGANSGCRAGGLSGLLQGEGAIVNSFNSGSVAGNYAGGLVGRFAGDNKEVILNSYNRGVVDGSARGGLIAGDIAQVASDVAQSGVVELNNVFYQAVAGMEAIGGGHISLVNLSASRNVGSVGSGKDYIQQLSSIATWTLAPLDVESTGISLMDALNLFISDSEAYDSTVYTGLNEWNDDAMYVNADFPVLSSIAGHQHNSNTAKEMKVRTCLDDGLMYYYCDYKDANGNVCNKLTRTEILKAPGAHDYTPSVKQAATCTQEGVRVWTCQNTNSDGTKCGDTFEDEIPAKGHTWAYKEQAPTCTGDGVKGYYCTECGILSSEAVILSATGHQYDDTADLEVIPATCTTDGYAYRVCTECQYRDLVETIGALGHEWGATTHKDSTCVGRGGNVHTCQRCMYEEFVGEIEGLSSAHNYVLEINETVEPTCVSPGSVSYRCTVCGAKTKNINDGDYKMPLGHNYIVTVVEPTCQKQGYTHYECSRCGDKFDTGLITTTAHNYEDKEEKLPSCFEDGYVLRKCKDCGNEDTIKYPAIGAHLMDYNVSSLSKAPTCIASGEAVNVCKRCGEQQREEVAALGHEWIDTVIEPTCMDSGYTLHACVRGDISYTDTQVSALGHDMVRNVIAPTTTHMGRTVLLCSRGDLEKVEMDFIAATPDAKFNALTKVLTLNVSGAVEIVEIASGDMETFAAEPDEAVSEDAAEPASEDAVETVTEDAAEAVSEDAVETVTEDAAEPASEDAVETVTKEAVKSDLMRYSLDKGATWITTEAASVTLTDEDIDYMISKQESIDLETYNSALESVAGAAKAVQRVNIADISSNPEIWVVRVGMGTEDRPIADSVVQKIEVNVADAPTFAQTIQPSVANGTGQITGVNDTMEYRSENDMTWTPVAPGATTIDNLSPGVYYLRIKASESALASEEIMVRINSYSAPIQPSENPIVTQTPPPVRASASPTPTPRPTASAVVRPSASPTPRATATASPNVIASALPTSGSSNTGGSGSTNGGQSSTGASSGSNSSSTSSGNIDGNNTAEVITNTESSDDVASVIKNDVYYTRSGNSSSSTTSSGSNKLKTAQTGDDGNFAVWLLAAGISISAVAAALTKKRKKMER